MLTKNTIKFVKSLQLKKNRREQGLFLVESGKSVLELLKSDFEIEHIYVTQKFFDEYHSPLGKFREKVLVVNEDALAQMSTLEQNHTALAVVKSKPELPFAMHKGEYVLLLDDIRDPGNLGTIIRTADWYGIRQIICSEGSAEFYNPKVIAATMGSFTRMRMTYVPDLAAFIKENAATTSYGAFLGGKDVHTCQFDTDGGMIVIGNESNGIHEHVEKYIMEKITIPAYGQAESLNAAIATAIILDNLRRNG